MISSIDKSYFNTSIAVANLSIQNTSDVIILQEPTAIIIILFKFNSVVFFFNQNSLQHLRANY